MKYGRHIAVLIVALIVAGLVSSVASGAFAATRSAHGSGRAVGRTATSEPAAPGLQTVANRSSCPSGDRSLATAQTPTTQAPGDLLVPTGAVSVLVCRYNGIKNPPPLNSPLAGAFGLIASHNVKSSGTAASWVTAMNKIVPTSGSYSCPFDFAADLVVYFRYASGPDYRYVIETGGCESVTSGSVSRLGLDAPIIARMTSAAKPAPYGTVKGKVEECGGPAPSRCYTSPHDVKICSGNTCRTYNKVLVRKVGASKFKVVKVRASHFTSYLVPGRYEFGLPAYSSSGKISWSGFAPAKVTVKSGATRRVAVVIPLP